MVPEIISSFKQVLAIILPLLKDWWWLFFLLLAFHYLKETFLWWRQDIFTGKRPKVLLEIKLPQEIERPIKVMENVFNNLWQIYDPPGNWIEKWIDGQYLLTLSCEIVSIDGTPHFYIRTPIIFRGLVESSIYSQYPEVEISEVPDYTNFVPSDIPNKEWDLFAFDYKFTNKNNAYPIRTYQQFFEEKPEMKEEKRLDPLAELLEGMGTFKKGEQLWVQIIIKPVTGEQADLAKEGKETVNKLVKRPEKEKAEPILLQAAKILLTGKVPGEKKEERVSIPEMELTPGEKDIVRAIENKISKLWFVVNIRFLYLGKKDVFYKPRIRIPMAYFVSFSTQNLNGFRPIKETATKVYGHMKKQRLYLRKRRMLRNYKLRLWPFYPRSCSHIGGNFILNSEELASLFHFPGKIVAPSAALERIETKKGEPPSTLPIE